MSQDNPRAVLSTFGDFGIYSTSSAENQCLKADTYKRTLNKEIGAGAMSIGLHSKAKPPGWGPASSTEEPLPGYSGWIIGSGAGTCFVNSGWEGERIETSVYGWLRTGSVARTYDGYQAIPTAVSACHSYFGPLAKLFFGPQWGEYVTKENLPYRGLVGTNNSAVDYTWACPPVGGLPARLLPYFCTDSSAVPFNSVLDSSISLSSSIETLLGRVYQASGAILAILSGGTLANYGQSDTSSRVFSAVSECMSSTDDGESLSLAERLARLESSVAQLIALTTYNYYVSGASVDSAPASGESVAEGVLNYLKTFLGSGAPAAPPEEEGGE